LINLINKYIKRFFTGHERSIRAKKNILASFIIKLFSVIIGFILVRIILDYLGKEQYGVWLTISAFLTWYSFFELGLGNGLRNKLAIALAQKDYKKGKEFVSTTYYAISFIAFICITLFLFINRFINWNKILNTNIVSSNDLYILTNIVFGFFFIQFVLKLISKILFADQKPALANAFDPLIKLLKLLLIVWLSNFSTGNLIYVGWAYSLSPIAIYLIGSAILFKKLYKEIRPSLAYVRKGLIKSLLNLGLGFFVIGIGNIIILQLVNVLIAQYFGPEDVTTYQVAFRLFTIPTMIFTIITSPLWSAYTEAWEKNDLKWIKNNIDKMKKILLYLYACALFILLLYQNIINIWLKNDIQVPLSLAIALFIHSIYTDYGRIYLQFTNGISKLYLQIFTTLLGAILIIPLSFIFCKILNLGLWGITLAVIISNIKYIFASVQYKHIIRGTATGIWNK